MGCTSLYYPQSNGKLEKFHDSLKNELLGGKKMTGFEYTECLVVRLNDYYDNVQLHSAIGYIISRNILDGGAPGHPDRKRKQAQDGTEEETICKQGNVD